MTFDPISMKLRQSRQIVRGSLLLQKEGYEHVLSEML